MYVYICNQKALNKDPKIDPKFFVSLRECKNGTSGRKETREYIVRRSPALDGSEHRTLFVSSFRSSRAIYLATVTFFPRAVVSSSCIFHPPPC